MNRSRILSPANLLIVSISVAAIALTGGAWEVAIGLVLGAGVTVVL